MAIAIARKPQGGVVVYAASLLNCTLLLAASAGWLIGAAPDATTILPLGLPSLGAHIRIDALSSFFLLVINLGGAAASLFAIGYGRHEESPARVLPYFPAYLAGMNLVVIADDAFTFLVAWEFMSLASWALVVSQHKAAANARAGYVYLVMASVGTVCLLLAFGLLAGPGGEYAFGQMRAHPPQGALAAGALVLVLVGAGSKAGLVPLHIWLPLAHPAAPSHVSALMSGVMTKVAIYGFIRIAFDLLSAVDWWWSALVLLLGALTAVLGLLYALMQSDLKRLLAYSTIENIGIVFAGLGLALAFKASDMAGPAALAMTASLFHVLNHAMFKSLLFFCAGAVLNATGERSMERLGGLIHTMPRTAIVCLVGCAAISALPPLNGFASEWLLFQGVLVSLNVPQWPLKFLIPPVGAMLALAAALAAACFVKVYGVTFLGRPRSPEAARAHEVDRWSLAAMYLLAALCLAAGLFPGFAIDMLAPAIEHAVGARMPVQSTISWLSIVPIAESRSSYNAAIIFVFLVLSGTLIAFVVRRVADRATRRSAIWDCGYPDPSTATQYSGSSFTMPIRRVFAASVFHVREQIDMPRPGEMRPARFQVKILDPAWRFIFGPVTRLTGRAALRLNGLQFLSIRSYLTLNFCALIVLLLVVAIWA